MILLLIVAIYKRSYSTKLERCRMSSACQYTWLCRKWTVEEWEALNVSNQISVEEAVNEVSAKKCLWNPYRKRTCRYKIKEEKNNDVRKKKPHTKIYSLQTQPLLNIQIFRIPCQWTQETRAEKHMKKKGNHPHLKTLASTRRIFLP